LVEEYLVQAAQRSQLLAHQLIWCTNTYSNESTALAFPIAERAASIKQAIIETFDDVARTNFEIEFSFIESVRLPVVARVPPGTDSTTTMMMMMTRRRRRGDNSWSVSPVSCCRSLASSVARS